MITHGYIKAFLLAAFLSVTMQESLQAAAPANDNRANAAILTGVTAAVSINNSEATKEAGDLGNNTLWWKWTAPVSGKLSLNTDTSTSRFLKLYVTLVETPGVLGGEVAYDDSYSSGYYPNVAFPVAAGGTYLISIGIADDEVGLVNLALNLSTSDPVASLNYTGPATMANNAFANRIQLTDANSTGIAHTTSGGREAGEPAGTGISTFWWTYRPTANGRLTLTTQGSSNIHKSVTVFQGSTLNSLRLVDERKPNQGTAQAEFSIPVTKDTDYQICFGTSSDYTGTMILTLSMNANSDISDLNIPHAATMANDNFANRISLSGNAVSAVAYNYTATREAGEPSTSGNRTFWWTYRPASDGWLTLSSQGSDGFHRAIAVYLGNTLTGLRLVNNQSPNSFSHFNLVIPVTANTDYQISFGATSDYGGSLIMNLLLSPTLNNLQNLPDLNIPLPATNANDNFSSSQMLAGNSVTAIGYNASASREPLEPNATGYRTLWWSWQAAASGETTVDFTGSDFVVGNIIPKFWTGSAVNSLTEVTPLAVPNKVVFNAVAGQTYHLSVGMNNANYYGSLVMTVYGAPSKPVFGTAGSALWVDIGEPLQLTAQADVANGQYQWFKNGKPIAGATGSVLNLPAATLADAGVYRATAKNALGTSQVEFNIGVADPASRGLIVGEGSTLVLNALAAGPGASFQWSRNSMPLSDGRVGAQTFSGTSAAKLSITQFPGDLGGLYGCAVSLPVPGDPATRVDYATGNIAVTTVSKPVVEDTTVPFAAVARGLTWQFEATPQPNKFIVTGLPKGLVLNAATGLVSGTPSAAGTFKVKVSAQNMAGTGAVREFALLVDDLEEGLAGTYTALVDRDPAANQDLGGTLTVTIAKTGALTGTLRLGPVATPFKGQVVVPNVAVLPHFTATIPRPKQDPLDLSLIFSPGDGSLFGTLVISGNTSHLEGWANRWTKDNKATDASGSYNVVLGVPGYERMNDDVPQGDGYFQVTVNGSTGVAMVKGVTPDGVAFTHSPVLWPTLEIPLHALLQKNKASIQGKPKIVLREAPTFAENLVNGSVSLRKTGPVSATDRLYAAGYDVDLTASGSKWVKPAPKTMIFDWEDEENNVEVDFSYGGIEGVDQADFVNQTFQLLNTGAAKLSTSTILNPCKTSFKLNPVTGLFSGQFILTDASPSPNGKPVKRAIPYTGILVPHLMTGFGRFLLPGLPTTSAPVKAGRVWFGPAQ